MMNIKKIALFASGSGTNAENIINYFSSPEKKVAITLILSNKSDAFVIERAKKHHIPYLVFDREQFYKSHEIVTTLQEYKTDLIVLAGFLWLVPLHLLKSFPNKIINIHPALLPKYGGKGMYGMHVHNTVIHNKDRESGITIHYVNEKYDKGDIIFQAKCKVEASDDANTLAQKIHKLEYEHFPVVIEKLLFKSRNSI